MILSRLSWGEVFSDYANREIGGPGKPRFSEEMAVS